MAPRHTLLAVLVMVIWSLNFLAVDWAMDGVPPLTALALRFVVTSIPLVFLIPRPAIGWRTLALIALTLGFGQFVLVYLALQMGLPLGLASLLVQSQALFSIVISAVFLRERPTSMQVVGVLVGTAGLAVVIAAQSLIAPWVPLVLGTGAGLVWAIGNILARRSKVQSGLSLVVWTALLVPIPSLLLSLVVDSPAVVVEALTSLSAENIVGTLFAAILSSLVGYAIWNGLLARYPASSVTPFTLLIPPLAYVAAWIAQGEQPTWGQVIGGIVMTVGVAIVVVKPRLRGREPDAVPDAGTPI